MVFAVVALFAGSSMCSAETQDLSGKWGFRPCPAAAGEKDAWCKDYSSYETIKLPGTTDEAGYGPMGPERKGVLTRRHEYVGVVWYQREISIPESWKDKEVTLFLERVLWQSRVWIDGIEKGDPKDSLCTPHIHKLGILSPGKHSLSVRIDNSRIHPLGHIGHAYGPQTQTAWNGLVGKIELQVQPTENISAVRAFTTLSESGWNLKVEASLSKFSKGLLIAAKLKDSKGKTVASAETPCGDSHLVSVDFKPLKEIKEWNEFSTELYTVELTLDSDGKVLDSRSTTFGFREIRHEGNQLLLSGKPVFLRGNLDCVHFPLTGYPSTHKKDWVKIFKIYKEHNLNHVRFHSWCPPEAAFEAADELGIYIQAETPIWVNEGRDEGKGPGKNDGTLDAFAQAEMKSIVDAYGNHPSFILHAIGNELGHSNFEVTGKWIEAIKKYDPRRLYAASTARTITPFCDYNATPMVPGIGWVRGRMANNTAWDYEGNYSKTTVPIIAHEIGQWPVYPDWKLIEKCSGVVRNTRLEKMKEQAAEVGVLDQQKDLTRASGSLNALLYKDEIESFLRTPSCRGFHLLSMQDFQGQGEAYVGWLDMFWDSKGTTDPVEFRGYCAPVVALARLPKYVFKADETLKADLLIRNNSMVPLPARKLSVIVKNSQGRKVYESGIVTPDVKIGDVATVGTVEIKLAEFLKGNKAESFSLILSLEGKKEDNSYPIWVYPAELPALNTECVMVTDRFDNATMAALEKGASVLLMADKLGDSNRQKKLSRWRPLYWSTPFFPGQHETLGLLVNNKHPAFRDFPTEHFNSWQWMTICENSSGYDLSGIVPGSYAPIAQPVCDFHLNRKIGTIMEFAVGKGKLLVCGYNLNDKRCSEDPACRQLRYSLLKYMAGKEFEPGMSVSVDAICELFRTVEPAKPVEAPGFGNAAFYLKPAGKLEQNNKQVDYSEALDEFRKQDGYSYKLSNCSGCWKDGNCSAWVIGGSSRLEIKTPKAVHGDLYIRFSDWNSNKRNGELSFEGGRIRLNLGKHDNDKKGFVVKFDVMREDTLDNTLTLDVKCTGGRNLMLTEIAFVLKE